MSIDKNFVPEKQGFSNAVYSKTAIVLHWTTAFAMILTIPLGIYSADSEGSLSDAVTNIHKCIGIFVLALTIVRIVWRIAHRPPALPTSMPRAFRFAARITHALFYIILLVMPLSGWWMTSAFPHRHAFGFGPFDIPFLPIAPDLQAAQNAHAIHQTLGLLATGLILLHILAALKHHFIDKDNVLRRMLIWS